jgi:hypothetical protein
MAMTCGGIFDSWSMSAMGLSVGQSRKKRLDRSWKPFYCGKYQTVSIYGRRIKGRSICWRTPKIFHEQ